MCVRCQPADSEAAVAPPQSPPPPPADKRTERNGKKTENLKTHLAPPTVKCTFEYIIQQPDKGTMLTLTSRWKLR